MSDQAVTHQVKLALIGGTLLTKSAMGWYYRLLINECDIEIHMPLPKGGRLAFEDGYPIVERDLDQQSNGAPLVLIAHSQSASYAIHYAASHANVVAVILLTSPVYGTLLALPARLLPRLAQLVFPSALDMCPGSPTLQRLANEELPTVIDRLTCIQCWVDGLIWPVGSSRVWGAQNTELPWWCTHLTSVFAHQVSKLIKDIRQGAEDNLALEDRWAIAS